MKLFIKDSVALLMPTLTVAEDVLEIHMRCFSDALECDLAIQAQSVESMVAKDELVIHQK